MRHFTLPARQCGKTASGPMTPARYVRLRREAAGLSRHDLARRITGAVYRHAHGPHAGVTLFATYEESIRFLELVETPGVTSLFRESIMAIGRFIAIDVDVYTQLAHQPVEQHPSICRVCGCSAHDPCGGHDGVCTLEHHLCSRCESAGAR